MALGARVVKHVVDRPRDVHLLRVAHVERDVDSAPLVAEELLSRVLRGSAALSQKRADLRELAHVRREREDERLTLGHGTGGERFEIDALAIEKQHDRLLDGVGVSRVEGGPHVLRLGREPVELLDDAVEAGAPTDPAARSEVVLPDARDRRLREAVAARVLGVEVVDARAGGRDPHLRDGVPAELHAFDLPRPLAATWTKRSSSWAVT